MWQDATVQTPKGEIRKAGPMANKLHDIGVAQIGTYSDAVGRPRRALVMPPERRVALDGTLPADVAGQAELAWTHIIAMLQRADMTVHDLVKITQYLLHASFIPDYVKVRSRFLGAARPASTLLVVPQSIRPEFLLEVEAFAAKI
jgi:enamine deaminase RidA (YjgF/YER057c/UK114 family)